jgi:hypothetical protein
MKRNAQSCSKDGAGDGTRTRDVQLGKMGNVVFSVTLMRMALIQGMENANKTVSHFGWCVNGGLNRPAGKVAWIPSTRKGCADRPHVEKHPLWSCNAHTNATRAGGFPPLAENAGRRGQPSAANIILCPGVRIPLIIQKINARRSRQS